MSGRKKPDRVVSQLSLWDEVEVSSVLPDASGSPAAGGLDGKPPDPPEDCLPRRALSLFDNTTVQSDYAGRIIKLLEKVSASGNSTYRVYDDWTRLVEASLNMLPAHLASAAQHGRLAEDTPEVERLFEEMRTRYHRPEYFEAFSKAFALLLDSTEHGYMDVIGEVFMNFTHPNPHTGQYFTPWNVCVAMAAMAIQNGEREVHERLKKAIDQSPLAQAALLAGLMFQEGEGDQAFEWFINRVIPACLPTYHPVTVCDPCVGSGRMLLAAAALYPDYMVRLGLVQFFGADIDPLMVRLARINMALYGLNGTGLRYAQALAQADPEVLRDQYRLTDDPGRARDSVVVMQDATPEKVMETVQLALFDRDVSEDGRADQSAPSPLSGKKCAGCGSSPWYLVDEVAYCRDCAPSDHSEEPAGELVEVCYE
jgi:hypothetical protein